jgi:methyltransferase-like protein/SAM-dependent methyltransferase
MTTQLGIRDTSRPAAQQSGTANSYDAVPYSVNSFPQTRPDRLATIATLFGMQPPPPARCRVLELACASGGNLIPLAQAHPGSHFVGIDLSGRQVADGLAVVAELGLENIELKELSILDVDEDFGTFDYILAHGVYSWVPAEVQDKILDICRRHLSTNGVAYVSYNTLPGWHARGAIREMLWYHTERFDDPAQRIREARGLLDFLARSVAEGDGGYGTLLRQELAVLSRTPDSYVLHEHLEDCNEPLYFHQFAERAAARGLQYLGEAQIATMVAGRFGEEAEKTLRQISPDLLHMEQYMDFLRNRMFRQTLLCHAGIPLDRALKPAAVSGFHIAGCLQPASANPDLRSGQVEEFRGTVKTLSTRDPLMKAAMLHLAEEWPLPVACDKLLSAARARLGENAGDLDDSARELPLRLLHCYTSGLVEFSLSEPGFCNQVSERPVASAYARLRARTGGKVTNLRLETVEMGEPSRLVLQHLDGRHDRAALSAILADWLEKASAAESRKAVEPAAQRAAQFVDQVLRGFARSALLVG